MLRSWLLVPAAWAALIAAGCLQVGPPPQPPPTTFSSWSPMGGFTMSSGANCAGRISLDQTPATVSDSCFTGPENVVLCTDATAAAAVGCIPGAGSLTVSGAAGHTVAYARVR